MPIEDMIKLEIWVTNFGKILKKVYVRIISMKKLHSFFFLLYIEVFNHKFNLTFINNNIKINTVIFIHNALKE